MTIDAKVFFPKISTNNRGSMKKALFMTTLVYSLAPLGFALSAEIAADSKIVGVTVYQDRALISRQAEVVLQKGANAILFENLPSALTEESLRAEGKGESAVTLLGAELKTTFSPEEVNPRVAVLTEELETLQDALEELQERSNALSEQKNFLDSVKNFSSVQVPKDIVTRSSPPADWMSLSGYLLTAYKDNGSESFVLRKLVREKNKEIEAKQRELQEINRPRDISKKTAVVNVEAKDAGKFWITLHYLVPQAAWSLSYDAKVYPDKKQCHFISYGNIRQWTGEDWKDVPLELSSAKPAIGGRMPELSPWFLDFFQNHSYEDNSGALLQKSSARMSMKSQANYDSMNSAPVALAQEAVYAEAAISQDMGSVTYEISKPTTILSDNRLYKSPVKSEQFEVTLDFEATPKLTPYVFIHAKVANDKEYPIVGGPMNVFVNDNYTGQSSIPTVGRGEKFDLYLGIDEEIKVKRTELVDKKKKTLLGLKARNDYGYKIEMENYKDERIQLTVIDQLPVSKNAEIKTELVSSTVEPTEKKDLGILRWAFNLGPKEKNQFQFNFFIEAPSDKPVSGV